MVPVFERRDKKTLDMEPTGVGRHAPSTLPTRLWRHSNGSRQLTTLMYYGLPHIATFTWYEGYQLS